MCASFPPQWGLAAAWYTRDTADPSLLTCGERYPMTFVSLVVVRFGNSNSRSKDHIYPTTLHYYTTSVRHSLKLLLHPTGHDI